LVVGLTVTVLGCNGSYPGPGGACSGYLVRGAGTTLWLDAGSGTLANLQQHVDMRDVDAVVLTHEHPDHWSDVEGFRVACTYVIERQDVPVYGPAGVRERLYPGHEWAFRWADVTDGDELAIGGLHISFSRTDHPPETLAVRVDADSRSLAYSADTGPGWSFGSLGAGIDLALCEATYPPEREDGGGHLNARQAGAMARRSQVGRLLITHLWPTVDPVQAAAEAAEAYGEPVAVVAMHEEYSV
jgi:ribonuclease BN (tRNA processing enzyme)